MCCDFGGTLRALLPLHRFSAYTAWLQFSRLMINRHRAVPLMLRANIYPRKTLDCSIPHTGLSFPTAEV